MTKSNISIWLAPVFLMFLALLAFGNSFPGSFIGDDIVIVQNNPLVSDIDLRLIFTTDYWGERVNSGLFRPLTILSFGLNRLVFGDSATAYHAINLILHLLVTVGLYSLLKQSERTGKVAWLAAALFAVHPLHTEVVNMAVGRAELLAALGAVVALWAWELEPKVIGWPLMVVAFLAGLLAKENAIVLLGLLPMLVWFRGEISSGGWRNLLPPYALLWISALFWLAWRTWGVVRSVAPDGYDSVYTPLASLSLDQRLLTALKYQWLYLRKLLLPYDLQGVYSGNGFFQPVSGLFSPEGCLVAIASILFLTGVAWLYRKRSAIGLGLLFYVVAATPTANIFFVSGVTFAERLSYLPSVGFCMALAALLAFLSEKFTVRWPSAIGSVLLSAFLLTTLLRNPDYASPQALWEQDVQRDPRNVLALMYLAYTHAETGRPEEADAQYQTLANQAPDFHEGLCNYAAFLLEQGRFEEAIWVALRVAESSKGNYPTNDLVLAQAYVKTGNFAQAFRWLEQLSAAYKSYGIYWEYRGRALEGMGDVAGAIDSYQQMGGYPPGSEIPLRLGALLLQGGQVNEARKVLEAAVLGNLSSAAGWNSLGIARAMTGDMVLARRAFEQATRLAPENAKYRENLKRVVAE
jgi:Tfp pilus assembly protein PilF